MPISRCFLKLYKHLPFFLCTATMFLFSCDRVLKNPEINAEPTNIPGMVAIHASNQTFFLGSKDSSISQADEMPAMNIGFSYDYFIDTIEVTQGMYCAVTGKSNELFDQKSGVGNTYPANNITWYDAVVFCNARSKIAGWDTVYEFSRIDSLPQGRIFNLAGLKTRFDRLGFRLPTEAEWEFAAKAASNAPFVWGEIKDSLSASFFTWFNGNADNALQKGALLKPNAFGLYDMAGNVLEWTNDGKVNHDGQSKIDFCGAFFEESLDRPVKGGSFVNSLSDLRLSKRSDIYPTPPSAALKYLGFRCVAGRISNPVFHTTAAIGSGRFQPLYLLESNVRPLLKALKTKLVFVNNSNRVRTLCFVDFSEINPSIRQFEDFTDVYFPTISPDGKRVSFCTRNFGEFDSSCSYIRNLDINATDVIKLPSTKAFAPQWWVNPQTFDTFLVYTNSTIINNSPSWNSDKTFLQKISQGAPEGPPIPLINDGSYYGGISGSGAFIATGYSRLLMRNLLTGEVRHLFGGPDNGKEPGDSSQVCNVSITPDASVDDEVLFLDFGYGKTSSIVGSRYGSHQVIFKSNFSGRTIRWYTNPQGTKEWDNPRWSNIGRYATAVTLDQLDNRQFVYIIDLRDSVYTRVIRGTDLCQPYLWIADVQDSPLDSIYRYNYPPSIYQEELANKMPYFWLQHDSLDLIFIGSSLIRNALMPSAIHDYRSLNMAYGGGDFAGETAFCRNYVFNHCKKIKLIAMSLDMGLFANPNGDNTWAHGFSQTIGYAYDRNHDFWQTGMPDAIMQISSGLCPSCATDDGFPDLPSPHGWGPQIAPFIGKMDWDATDSNYLNNLRTLRDLAGDCAARNIHLVMLNTPISPFYKNQQYYGYFGPSRETALQIIDDLRKLEQNNHYFHLYDANLDGNHDYSNADAWDFIHLSYQGAQKITARVDSLIHIYLK
jgi:uncharacterized protein (TIGR02171 family)